MKKIKYILLWCMLILPYLMLIPLYKFHKKAITSVENANFIVINKNSFTLCVYNYKGKNIFETEIATGKNTGNKEKVGDMKTPEGVFKIVNIEDSHDWTHDFKDDTLGVLTNVYGPYFIRLETPGFKGIGIHGTHDNKSLGTNASEGCVRMQNEELLKLVELVDIGTVVVITSALN